LAHRTVRAVPSRCREAHVRQHRPLCRRTDVRPGIRRVIYLRADAASIPDFEREGSAPFVYPLAKRRPGHASQHFWRLPERLYDDPDELAAWAGRALAVAESRKTASKKAAPKGQKKRA
jgi:DNA transformation protein